MVWRDVLICVLSILSEQHLYVLVLSSPRVFQLSASEFVS